jgi:hypothetical protein
MTGGEPPRVSNIMKTSENILSELEGNNWVEDASRNNYMHRE